MYQRESRRDRCSSGRIFLLVCVLLVAAILLTYTLTAEAYRRMYTEKLLEQQQSYIISNHSVWTDFSTSTNVNVSANCSNAFFVFSRA